MAGLVVSCSLVASGCSDAGRTPAEPGDVAGVARSDLAAPPASSPTAVPPPPPGPVAEVRDRVRLPSRVDGGRRWQVVDILSAREVLIRVDVSEVRSRVALLDPATGRTRYLGPAFPGGVFAADADAEHIVWITVTGEDLFTFPWRLWSHDRRRGTTRVIADAPDVGVDPVPVAPDGTRPTLHRGRVWLTAVRRVTAQGAGVPAIYSVPATGGRLREEVRGAFDAYASRTALVFVRAELGSFERWRVLRRPWGSTTAQVVDAGGRRSRFSGISVSPGGAIMWQRMRRAREKVNTVKVLGAGDTQPRRAFSSDDVDSFAYYPEMTDRYAMFTRHVDGRRSGNRPFVYDLATGTLHRTDLGLLQRTPFAAGDRLVWRGPEPDDPVYVGRLTVGP